jgi:aldehyde:ferredoxin oxidoreductase
MYGFYGRSLTIDLSNHKYEIETIPDEVFARYLGGKGLATYLLACHLPKGIDPLSPENCLIFATGPVTNSMIWGSSRYGVYSKSPQTGIYAESYAGGRTPEAVDATGYDAILVKGRSSKPSVLVIDPEGVSFHAAGSIWGLDTIDAENAIHQAYNLKRSGGHKAGAVVIGPAGENRVRFSVIKNDHWRSAGRTGMGTVMGAKNLKAIIFQGDRRRSLFDPEGVKAFSKVCLADAKKNPSVELFRSKGTSKMVEAVNLAQAFPSRYWADHTRDGWENLSAEALHTSCDVTPQACAKCYIGCSRNTRVRQGRHAGLQIGGPEYETIFAFGGLCLVDHIEEVIYLNDICDRKGIDTITAGNLCGFTIEAAKRGKIDYKIDYGDVDAIAGLLEMIVKREGIGDVLAKGIRHAARIWEMEDAAVHVKGLEPPGYDPRVLNGVGLGYAVSDRGACHLRATFHRPELNGTGNTESLSDKAALFIDYEDRLTLMDSLILCRFYRDMYPWEKLARIVHLTTGLPESIEILKERTAAIAALVRQFNIQEGMTFEDDHLSPKLYNEKRIKGHGLLREDMEGMIRKYYTARGWDIAGNPGNHINVTAQ